jgi:hypothetical protein
MLQTAPVNYLPQCEAKGGAWTTGGNDPQLGG